MLRSLSPRREQSLAPHSDRFTRSLMRFEEEMEDLVHRVFGGESFMPMADLVEKEQEFVVSMDLPGMKAEDVKVELHGRELWISGERKGESEEEGKSFHRMERHHGEFRRVFSLPQEVDEDHIEATFQDGVLAIHVPKSEEARPRHINVKS